MELMVFSPLIFGFVTAYCVGILGGIVWAMYHIETDTLNYTPIQKFCISWGAGLLWPVVLVRVLLVMYDDWKWSTYDAPKFRAQVEADNREAEERWQRKQRR